jgi:hypothetical protein
LLIAVALPLVRVLAFSTVTNFVVLAPVEDWLPAKEQFPAYDAETV